MKTIVISGSSKLKERVNYWCNYFKENGYEILDYPKFIEKENYKKDLAKHYLDFYTAINNTDTFFLMNEEKNGIAGYIGASAMSELNYVVMQNQIHGKNIDIYILNVPSDTLSCYDEVNFFLDMGWIKLFRKTNNINLKEDLENYIPFNEQETKDKDLFLKCINIYPKFHNSIDYLLTRDNSLAHFSSTAFVVNKQKNKVLLIHHNIFNGWAYPGGHADGEEDLLSVAIREVEEETGVKATPLDNSIFSIQSLPINGHVKNGKYVSAHIHLNVIYLLEADDTQPLKIKPDENKDVKWFPLTNVPYPMMVDFFRAIHSKLIKKLLSNHPTQNN